MEDFPSGPVDKNPPAQCKRHGFSPWSRKILHAAEQLSTCATTAEPRGVTTEARGPGIRALQQESSPHSLQLGKSPHSIEDPVQPLNTEINRTGFHIIYETRTHESGPNRLLLNHGGGQFSDLLCPDTLAPQVCVPLSALCAHVTPWPPWLCPRQEHCPSAPLATWGPPNTLES